MTQANEPFWITYTVTSESGAVLTHFSKLRNLDEARSEWEREFNQKTADIVLDTEDFELDFSDLFNEAEA